MKMKPSPSLTLEESFSYDILNKKCWPALSREEDPG